MSDIKPCTEFTCLLGHEYDDKLIAYRFCPKCGKRTDDTLIDSAIAHRSGFKEIIDLRK